MEKEYTLREWVESVVSESYFGTTLERIAMADQFMEHCKRLVAERKYAVTVADLNPDTITIKVNDDNGTLTREFGFKQYRDKKMLNSTRYNNLEYAPESIVKRCATKRKKANMHDIARRFSDEDKAYTIAVNVFYIVFACHPFKGAAYYSSAVEDFEKELEYFKTSGKFIFAPEHYEAEKIDGYHKCPHDLWLKLGEEQRNFFTVALKNNHLSCAKLFATWEGDFNYSYVVLKAICGEEIPALAFGNDHALIATDIAVWDNYAKCVYCKKEIKEKCKRCPHAANALVTVTTVNLRLTVTDAALGKKATRSTERTFTLRVGDVLTGRMLDSQNGGDDVVFRVIPTKKMGILGCEYLGDRPLLLEGADAATFMVLCKSKKFKLSPKDKIYLTSSHTLEIMEKTGAAGVPENGGEQNDKKRITGQ